MPDATTAHGTLLVVAIVWPAIGILLSLALGGRQVEWIAFLVLAPGFCVAAIVFVTIWQNGERLAYIVGDWAPPLGITLRADGLSAAMMLAMAAVMTIIGVYAHANFNARAATIESRAPFAFWVLTMGVSSGMNMIFVAGDLFTLYVALELLTFAAVPLVSLDGRGETLQAALRYLLFALLGSILYLVGTAFLYGSYGTLDIVLLSQQVRLDPATVVAGVLMTIGLFAKTALFPLNLWLPPAHAGAPAAASALLSAIVVKGSFFLVIRLWFDALPGVLTMTGTQIFGALGAAAIVFGNIVALRQKRLKLLIAYSTVAQIGHLFLMFPLSFDVTAGQLTDGVALTGGVIQTISHATAKSAMFMAAGLVYSALGHDRIADLAGVARAYPMTIFAFAIGGVCLIGLPPSGGFLAKWLLLEATIETGQWWWAVVLLVGGLFTAAYTFIVVSRTLAPANLPLAIHADVPRYQEWAALTLALLSLALGLVALGPIDVVGLGRAGGPQ
jgi:formate hydrogenlyase subunit 3/multisubunit Na+/H+ antiporter MnhD subunit